MTSFARSLWGSHAAPVLFDYFSDRQTTLTCQTGAGPVAQCHAVIRSQSQELATDEHGNTNKIYRQIIVLNRRAFAPDGAVIDVQATMKVTIDDIEWAVEPFENRGVEWVNEDFAIVHLYRTEGVYRSYKDYRES